MIRGRRLRTAVLVVVAVVAGLVAVGPGAGAQFEVHLTAAGDYGARAATDTVLRKVAELDPDAHLALGDLKYGDVPTEDAWCNYVKARVGEGFPFELISGNHDSLDVADGAINNFSACLPNQVPGVAGTYGRQYTFDLPSPAAPLVRVIQVSAGLTFEDGRWTYAAGSARYQWVSDAIDAGRAAGAKWIVVSNHIPCWSIGQYSCPAERDLYDLLVAKRVDLVLHGHEHAYLRTHQLRAGVPGCATVPAGSVDTDCVADTDGAFAAGAGTVFATVGTGGTPLRDLNTADTEAGYFGAWSGLNANPTYGLLDLRMTDTTLTAGFVGTSGGTFTDSFTITRGVTPPNQAPTASFTASITDRTLSVDGTGSSDPEGGALSYAWDFGDGTTGSGATATKVYAAAGTYTVQLTVTDPAGATATTTRSVTATDPPPPPPPTSLAADAFGRTTTGGWGTADVGGPWSVVGTASWYSVSGGQGRQLIPTAGRTATTRLGALASAPVAAAVDLSFSAAPTGGGYYSYLGVRQNGTTQYQLRPRFMPTSTTLTLYRVVNGTATAIASANVAGVYAAGQTWRVELVASGTSPTTLRGRVWNTAGPAPAAQVTATDSTVGLQVPGGIELSNYLSSSSTAPATASYDNLLVTTP